MISLKLKKLEQPTTHYKISLFTPSKIGIPQVGEKCQNLTVRKLYSQKRRHDAFTPKFAPELTGPCPQIVT